jgi:hypothetical protein
MNFTTCPIHLARYIGQLYIMTGPVLPGPWIIYGPIGRGLIIKESILHAISPFAFMTLGFVMVPSTTSVRSMVSWSTVLLS